MWNTGQLMTHLMSWDDCWPVALSCGGCAQGMRKYFVLIKECCFFPISQTATILEPSLSFHFIRFQLVLNFLLLFLKPSHMKYGSVVNETKVKPQNDKEKSYFYKIQFYFAGMVFSCAYVWKTQCPKKISGLRRLPSVAGVHGGRK